MRLPKLDAVVGRVQFENRGRFCPTLVIGSGGSGTNTVRRVKRILEQRYGQIGLVKFLLIDCDQHAYDYDPMLADVEPQESASIVATNASSIYQEVRKGLRHEIETWLPKGVGVDLLRHADGAGGIRPVGRFALYAQFPRVRERLQEACRQVMQVEALVRTTALTQPRQIELDTNEPRVYIVNSICGGTGSSIFIDLALLTRYTFRESNVEPTIIGLFYLPSVFRNERGITPAFRETILANAYAGLMELEFFCDPDIENKRWEIAYPGIGTIIVDGPVFDECYLIEGINAEGHQLASKEEVFEMTARSLYIDIGSPVGARVRSAKRNTSVAVRTSPCLETSKFRLMNSLATTQVKVPIEALAHHCALRAARAVISQLLGSPPSVENRIQRVDTFLRANRLEERGEQDQILDRLLTGSDGHLLLFTLGRSRQEIQQQARALGYRSDRQQAQYFANWVGERLEEVRTQLLSQARTLVNENKKRVLAEALAAVRQQMLTLAQQEGLAACEAFLEELSSYCRTVVEELTREAGTHDSNRPTVEEEISQKRTFLNNYGSLLDRLSRKNEDEKTMDALLDLTERYANAELRQVARNAALELLGSQQPLNGIRALRVQLEEWLYVVRSAISALKRAEALIQDELGRRSPTAPVGSTYILEQVILPLSQFDSYYQRANLDIPQLTQKLWQELTAQDRSDFAPLNALSQLRAEPETLVDLIASQSAPDLMRSFEQNATIIQILQEQEKADANAGQLTQSQVQLMLQVCKPFWTTATPRGRDSYESFMAVTIPCRFDDPNLNQVKQLIEETVREAGFTPELVQTDYPFAIEICVRAYGARAYYLSSTAEMKHHYDSKMKQPNVRHLQHADKRYLAVEMPKLHPEPQELAELLFAWGIAYGYIATRGEYYYTGVEWRVNGGQPIPTPKYESDWSAKITHLMDPTWQGSPQTAPDPYDQIAQGRRQAMEQFVNNSDMVAKISRVSEEYVRHWGSQRVVRELTEYLNRLDEVIRRTNNLALRDQYRRERALLETYTQRLQGRA